MNELIQNVSPKKEVWLIEDNPPFYKKTARLYLKEIESETILNMEWSANLPDLHLIKNVWDKEKSLLAFKLKYFRGARKNIKGKIRKEITNMWKLKVILVEIKEITSD